MFSEPENMRVSCSQSRSSEVGPANSKTATRWRNLDRSREKKTPHMCFCETNPPFFDNVFDVTRRRHRSCDGNSKKKSVGSFWKTNPPLGDPDVLFRRLYLLFERLLDQIDAAGGGADV